MNLLYNLLMVILVSCAVAVGVTTLFFCIEALLYRHRHRWLRRLNELQRAREQQERDHVKGVKKSDT